MTEEALKHKYTYRPSLVKGIKSYKVGFIVYRKEYFTITKNKEAIERINMDKYPKRLYSHKYVTKKEALKALYDEVKRENY